MTKNLLYLCLILFSTALSVGAGLNKCTEGENGLVYCENVSSQGQAFLKDRDNEEDLEEITSSLLKRSEANTCLNDKYLGSVLDFSIFSFDKIEATSFSLTGKIAAKNSVSTNSFSIYNNGKSCSAGTLGYVIYTDKFKSNGGGGTIEGGIHYGTSKEIPQNTVVQDKCPISNDPKDNLPYDYVEVEKRMIKISEKLSDLKTNAKIEAIPNQSWDYLKFTLDKNIKTYVINDDVFFLNKNQNQKRYNLVIDNSQANFSDSELKEITIVINIKDESVNLKGNEYNLNNFHVLWNFPNASNVHLSNGPFRGFYLAPKANVIIDNSTYNIKLVCKSVDKQSSLSFQDYYFGGCIPNVNVNDVCLNKENDEHFGVLSDFGVFAFDKIDADDFTLKGKVAAKNSISSTNFKITSENGKCSDGTLKYSVFTNTFKMNQYWYLFKYHYGEGSIEGGIHYGNKCSISDDMKKTIIDNKCTISNKSEDNLKFNDIETRMNEISKKLSELPTNAEIENSKLTLNEETKIYVVNADNIDDYNFIVDKNGANINANDVTIIINIKENSFTFNSALSNEFKNRIIWNFPNANYLKFANGSYYGVYIAPKAEVEFGESGFFEYRNGKLYGNLVCKSLSTDTISIESGSFNVCVPNINEETTPQEPQVTLRKGAPQPKPSQEETPQEETPEDDIIYEVDGVKYRNETVCSDENVESRKINSDIVFIFDESVSMCDYINALRAKLQSFITKLREVDPTARFALIGFGGKPRIYSAFTNNEETINKAFNKLDCKKGGQESGLEAIRMFLNKSNKFLDNTLYSSNNNFVNTNKLNWRDGSTKTIILVTDEDSDLPHYSENRNDLQVTNLKNTNIDINDYYNKEITDVDKFFAFPALLKYEEEDDEVHISTKYSTYSYIEPVFSPAYLTKVKNGDKEIVTFYRSGSPLVLSEPYQKEVNETAQLLIKDNVQLFMLINDDLQSAQGEDVANSQFNENNPYWNTTINNPDKKDDSSTITAQYGNPLIDDVSNSEYDKRKILEDLIKRKQENSIQGQILANGGFCRAFNINKFASADENDMVNLFYTTIVTTVKNCVVKPVKIVDPTTTIEYETTTYIYNDEYETSISSYKVTETTPIQEVVTTYSTYEVDREVPTTSVVEEIETIYEFPSEFPTYPYMNSTTCENADINSQEINTDIVFIFDESSSMCPYIDAMRSKLNFFVKKLKDANANARFAVIGFGGKPRIYSSFTSDINAVEKAFEKLNCDENGQESGLEAIRMFLNESNKFINKIDSIYGQKNFRDIYQLKWRDSKYLSKTIIVVTDEDSDLPHYEENMNDLQKANFKNDVNIKSLDGKDVVASDVKAFGGYPYYLNKNNLPEYTKENFFEPVFSPASLTTVNGIYTFYRNGSPLVLSEAYQKEVDETAALINEKGVKLFMLLNDDLAESQGDDVANSQYDSSNPYWVKKGTTEKDDSSTITAQYGNPLIDKIQNVEFDREAILSELTKRHQEKSLQGQILKDEKGFCRVFNMKKFTDEDSEKMVELFYETVVKNVVKCIISPVRTETTETITTTVEYSTNVAYDVTSVLTYTTETPYIDTTTSVVVETTTNLITEPTTFIEVTTSYIEEIVYPTIPYRNVTRCVDEETEVKEIDSDIVFIVDESASMCKYIDAMKEKLNTFIEELNKVKASARYAIIGFGGEPRIYSAFTDDAEAVKKAFTKLNCNENGQESGLEAIRMFIEKSEKFVNKIDNKTGGSKFTDIDKIKWRESSTKTIIFLTDEDSDLPIYPENRNDLQQANVNGNINVKNSYDEKELSSTEVDKFMGFPYYMNKHKMPSYSDNVYYEPAFGPVILTSENGYYTFYRSGSPLVLSSAFQKEVDDTAKLIQDNNIQLFLLLNDHLAEAQGSDVSNSHFNTLNPYWNEHFTKDEDGDDSSTVTAQYGNPTIDNINKVHYNPEEIYNSLVAKNQQNSLQGQILSNGGFCRVFNLDDFTGNDSSMMVELFYKIVVRTVKNCKPLPVPLEEDCLSYENDDALRKLSGFNLISFTDINSHKNQIQGRIAAKNTVNIGSISVNTKDKEYYCTDEQEKYAIYAKDFTLDDNEGNIFGGIHHSKSIDLNDETRNLLQSHGCAVSDEEEDKIDIKALKRRFVGISNSLNGLEATSEIETDGYNYFINLNIGIKHYIINANKDTFKSENGGYYLGINNPNNLKPEDITIIINMSGDKIKFNNNGRFAQLESFKERIIWNMPEAEEIEYNEVDIYGLILAPKAKVIGRGGNIIGKVVAKSIDIESTEIKDIEVGACIPNGEIEEEPITVTITEDVTSTAYKDFITTSTDTVTDYTTITQATTTEVESTSVSTQTEVSTINSTVTETTTLTTTTVTDYSTATATATVETTSTDTVTAYTTVVSVATSEVESTSVSTQTEVSTINSTVTETTTLTTKIVEDISTVTDVVEETTTSTATVEVTSTATTEVTNTSLSTVVETSVSLSTVVETVYSTSYVEETTSKPTTTVEEVQKSTTIPSDTTSSIERTTSTVQSTTTTETIEKTSTPSDPEPSPQPSGFVPPTSEDEQSGGGYAAAAAFAGVAGVAAAVYYKLRQRPPTGNQLADNVFEDNVGMENPLYEGQAGQNENPLYEANLNFDSLEDNMEAFA